MCTTFVIPAHDCHSASRTSLLRCCTVPTQITQCSALTGTAPYARIGGSRGTAVNKGFRGFAFAKGAGAGLLQCLAEVQVLARSGGSGSPSLPSQKWDQQHWTLPPSRQLQGNNGFF